MNIRRLEWEPGEVESMKFLVRVDYIVIHHTESHDAPIEEVNDWHEKRGWKGVGYHFLIRANGDIEIGRPEDREGAHVEKHNWHSLGISLTGDFTKGVPTKEQMDTLTWLVLLLKSKYPRAQVVKHLDLSATACPGDKFPWDEFVGRLQWKEDIVNKAQEAGLITQGHDPDEPAPKWFVLQVVMNALKGR